MLTIKMLAVASALVVGSAAITYTVTTTFLINEPVAASPDTACNAILAEMRAAKEKEDAQHKAFQEWSSGTPAPHGLGKGF